MNKLAALMLLIILAGCSARDAATPSLALELYDEPPRVVLETTKQRDVTFYEIVGIWMDAIVEEENIIPFLQIEFDHYPEDGPIDGYEHDLYTISSKYTDDEESLYGNRMVIYFGDPSGHKIIRYENWPAGR